LESTVVDVTARPASLLRPGLVSVRQLENAIGAIQRKSSTEAPVSRSPGQMTRHYSPATPVEFTVDDGRQRAEELQKAGFRVGLLTFGNVKSDDASAIASLPTDPKAYGAGLFAALHHLDEVGLDRLVIALPPEDDDWLAVHDRLSRMAGGNVSPEVKKSPYLGA